MRRRSPPFAPPKFELAAKIIRPASQLKITIKPNALIFGGQHFALKAGISRFLQSILNQMEKTETRFQRTKVAEAVELGLHLHFGSCLQSLVKELQWAKANGQTCLYQSIWYSLILWAGGWPSDPHTCHIFENACDKAGLKPYSKAQFDIALESFKNGQEQTPYLNHILPIRPEDFRPLYLVFEKGRKIGPFDDIQIQFGLDPYQFQSDEFPIYAKSARQRPRQASKDQVPSVTRGLGNILPPAEMTRNSSKGGSELVGVGREYSPRDPIQSDSDLDGSELME